MLFTQGRDIAAGPQIRRWDVSTVGARRPAGATAPPRVAPKQRPQAFADLLLIVILNAAIGDLADMLIEPAYQGRALFRGGELAGTRLERPYPAADRES